MPTPDLGDYDANLAVLGQIVQEYPDGSPERRALDCAAHAMAYVNHVQLKEKFQQWVDSWRKPPTALQVLHAKMCGIEDFPHELMDESLREIEQVLERLRQTRT